MATDGRARAMAQRASALAAGARVELPPSLTLWRLAGCRPRAGAAASDDPAGDLGGELERLLSGTERRQGAHYTPRSLADRVAAMALQRPGRLHLVDPSTVVDPACGGGSLLLAAGRRLVAGGAPVATVARDLLWGADLDPLAAAVTEAAIAIWSGGVEPAPGHIVEGDTLSRGSTAWPDPPAGGFGALVGNPPFQGQLARATARSGDTRSELREHFGTAASSYVDTAALFLLAGVELVAPGGSLAMIVPQSVVAARDALGVREAVNGRAHLRVLWAPDSRPFGAAVNVCVVALEVGRAGSHQDWSARLADASGVPQLELPSGRTVGDAAAVVAGFRDEYYALVGHVREAGERVVAPLITSGAVDVGVSRWGRRPARFAKQRWQRPEVDLDGLRASSERVAGWVVRLRTPKVVVASQTRVVEAAIDRDGTWVPCTPVVSVVPHHPDELDLLAAALCAPPVSVWAARRAVGTALSPDALRISAPLVAAAPLPIDRGAWVEAARLLAVGDLARYGAVATAMYGLQGAQAARVNHWWSDRAIR